MTKPSVNINEALGLNATEVELIARNPLVARHISKIVHGEVRKITEVLKSGFETRVMAKALPRGPVKTQVIRPMPRPPLPRVKPEFAGRMVEVMNKLAAEGGPEAVTQGTVAKALGISAATLQNYMTAELSLRPLYWETAAKLGIERRN